MDPTQQSSSAPHPHSKLLFMITLIVIVVAAAAFIYYWQQSRTITQQSGSTKKITTEEARETAQTGTSQEGEKSSQVEVIVSKDASAKTVAKELDQINIGELKTALRELSSALALLK